MLSKNGNQRRTLNPRFASPWAIITVLAAPLAYGIFLHEAIGLSFGRIMALPTSWGGIISAGILFSGYVANKRRGTENLD
ncbi:MAG: hypothetical protein ACRCSF_02560 [Mycobacteriaceae bacterium]